MQIYLRWVRMNWAPVLFQGRWQDLWQGGQGLLCIWNAESGEASVPALGSLDVMLARQPQKSLSDIYYVTTPVLALQLGKAVFLVDLIIWVQYLQEFVLSQWMLVIMETKKNTYCSLRACGSWDLGCRFLTPPLQGLRDFIWIQDLKYKAINLSWPGDFALKQWLTYTLFCHGSRSARDSLIHIWSNKAADLREKLRKRS